MTDADVLASGTKVRFVRVADFHALRSEGPDRAIFLDAARCTNVCSSRGAINVTKPNEVLPRICGTRFFKDFGGEAVRDKNDRFCLIGYVRGFLTEMGNLTAPASPREDEPPCQNCNASNPCRCIRDFCED